MTALILLAAVAAFFSMAIFGLMAAKRFAPPVPPGLSAPKDERIRQRLAAQAAAHPCGVCRHAFVSIPGGICASCRAGLSRMGGGAWRQP